MGLTAALACSLLAAGPANAPGEWTWIVPREPQFAHPSAHALPLSSSRPEDVTLRFTPDGRVSFAQLRFGAPDSVRVALALVERDDGTVSLYADANRDRVLDESERLAVDAGAPAATPTFTTRLIVAAKGGDASDLAPRDVRFRLGASRIALTYSVVGCLEGVIEFAGRKIRVRRVDGDGNGMLADLQDALWLDLSGSGAFDPLEERFACAPLLQIEGKRWLVRSDPFGRRLALEEVKGTGTFRFKPTALPEKVKAQELSVTLAARDGSAFLARGADATLALPAGEYRVAALTVALTDPDLQGSTTYVFTRGVEAAEANWHALAAGATVDFDPLGSITCALDVDPASETAKGAAIRIQPQLTTSEGLRIVSATTGEASIELRDPKGTCLAQSHSGFA